MLLPGVTFTQLAFLHSTYTVEYIVQKLSTLLKVTIAVSYLATKPDNLQLLGYNPSSLTIILINIIICMFVCQK